MWIRITGKTEEEEHRAPFCITFFLHTVHQHNQTTQSPCWIMNNKMKRKLRSSKQGRKDSSWHFKWEEVTERFTATAPDGRSYFGQTTWLGRELQLGKQKGAGRRKGTKEKKIKQWLKMEFLPCSPPHSELCKLQNRTATPYECLRKRKPITTDGYGYKSSFWPGYGLIISPMPGFL